MLAAILRWFSGWVQVEAEGGFPERLLNDVAAQNIVTWSVRCRGEMLRFGCFAREYRLLRPLARRACVRLRVQRKYGLPFLLFRYRHRKGIAVGLVVYALVLALLSPRIWVIQVVGNDMTPTEDILAVTSEVGVRIGARMDALDRKQLETTGVDRLPTLGWIAVNPDGCVARVEVTERKQTPQVLDLSAPSNLVALRDGRIAMLTVVSGQKQVKLGEAVSAGTVLISGLTTDENGGEQWTRAYGEVWAYTQRQLTVSVPLSYTTSTADGVAAVCPTVTFLGYQLPLYSHTPSNGLYTVEERQHVLSVNGLALPLGVRTHYYIRLKQVVETRTQEEASRLAQTRLTAQEQLVFGDNEHTVLSRKEYVQDGRYTLTVTYSCLENIAVEQPVSQ